MGTFSELRDRIDKDRDNVECYKILEYIEDAYNQGKITRLQQFSLRNYLLKNAVFKQEG